MKKLLFLILSLLLLASLCSCGKSQAVIEVETMINTIDVVTLDSGDALETAEAAYASLKEKEQVKVENYQALVDARANYDQLVLEENQRLEKERNEAIEQYNSAVDDYNNAVDAYNEQAQEFNTLADTVNSTNSDFKTYLDSIKESGIYDAKAYDGSTIQNLQEEVANAGLIIVDDIESIDLVDHMEHEVFNDVETSDIQSKTDTVIQATDVVNENTDNLLDKTSNVEIPDYSITQDSVQEKWNLANDSVAIQDQITNPSEDFVVSRLYYLPNDISALKAATEDHDPNNMLHKAGGYTSAVFFRSWLLDDSLFFEDDILDIGTDGGGCVEVFATEEEAQSRNTYLAAFDSTFLRPGSHTVLGTMVIRTSDELTATQQSNLEAKIIYVLTYLVKD